MRFDRVPNLVLLALPPLLWSTMIVAGRAVGGVVPPLALTFWTWAVAALVLAVPVVRARSAIAASADWGAWIAASVLGVALFQALYYLGLERTSAVSAALLAPTLPVITALVARVVLGERMGSVQTTGSMLSLTGAIWIAVGGELSRLREFELGSGELLILGANLSMAGYTVWLRIRPADLAPLPYMGVLALIGTALALPAWSWELSLGRGTEWSAPTAIAVIYIGAITYALGYVFWNQSVARNGATLTANFQYLIPPFGVALAALLLGESLALYHGLGGALIFIGIYLCLHAGTPAVRQQTDSVPT